MYLKYLLTDLKDIIPPQFIRKIKKVLRKKKPEVHIILRDGNWVERKSKRYQNLFLRDFGKKIRSNIVKKTPLPAISYRKDYFIEKKLHSGYYTTSDILVIKNPYGMAPLTALSIFFTPYPCRVRIIVEGENPADDVSGITVKGRYHRVPVIGLYPGRENIVTLSLLDDNDLELRKINFKIKTKSLPVNMRDMVHIVKKNTDSAIHLMFVYGGDTLYPYAFDRSGKIRYYLQRTPKAYGLFPLSSGKFLFSEKNILKPTYHNPHSTNILEMDLLGRVYKIYNVEKGLHHDACEISPNGNILGTSSSLKGCTEDSIIEINRHTGKVVKEIVLGELLDDKYKTSVDWIHINTVSYIPENNTVIACLRNLHSIICIDWSSGEMLWLLSNPKFWEKTSVESKVLKPIGDQIKWFYQAHASYRLNCNLDNNPDTFHIIVFDNHWNKRRPVPYFDKDKRSYVRIYTINEKERTVSLLKEFAGLKSRIRSNGIFIENQKRVFSMNGYLELPVENCDGMIYEYDYDNIDILNQYATVNSFYRAYEFWSDYEELSKSMDIKDTNYFLGELEHPIKIPYWKPDQWKYLRISIKEKVKGKTKTKKNARKKIRKEERLKNYKKTGLNQNTDRTKDIAKIHFMLIEDILYIRAKDHLIEQLYLSGEKHTFMMDFTTTKQHTPALFGECVYYIAIPLTNVDADNYWIYINCMGTIYKTGKKIDILARTVPSFAH